MNLLAGRQGQQHTDDQQQQPCAHPDTQHNEAADAAQQNQQDSVQSVTDVHVPPEAFPWESMYDDINRLVHKGQDAGWLAQPAEVRLAVGVSS